MAWIEEQIEARRTNDERSFQHALEDLYVGATGDAGGRIADAVEQARGALAKVMAYYGATAAKVDGAFDSIETMLERSLDSTGIMFRKVSLPADWYKTAVGCLLGLTMDGVPVALIPRRGFYYYTDPATGAEVRAGRDTLDTVLARTAYCFYRPLPDTKLGLRDFVVYVVSCLDVRDYVVTVCAAFLVALIGIAIPALNSFLFGPVLDNPDEGLVVAAGAMLVAISLAQVLIGGVRKAVLARVDTKLSVSVQAAIMMRILSLPASFFRDHSAGELAARLPSAATTVSQLEQLIFGATLTSIFSLIYVLQMALFWPSMAAPSLLTSLAMLLVNAGIGNALMRETRLILDANRERSALETGIISAIQKIRVTGAEKRVFARWAASYAKGAALCYGHPGILMMSAPVTALTGAVGLFFIYLVAVQGGLEGYSDFMAYFSSYGLLTASFATLSSSIVQTFSIKPNLEQLAPIFEALPESSERKTRVTRLRGAVTLTNVSFTYPGSDRPLFENLSLSIKPGEHVAIVGKTGCGKSTIMRLMLGLEQPDAGEIRYDNATLAQLDVESLRRAIGVVLQNGKLLRGSIYSNIIISNPSLTERDAWEAAEMAGVADDIRRMPMGMNTYLGDGGTGISGGQRQRIMIARALARKPSILMLDEATSALDNITQRTVAASLDSLTCTRIVIAHRLSTVRTCDRILVLDQGRIAEEGTYDELIEHGGIFADLVARQRI